MKQVSGIKSSRIDPAEGERFELPGHFRAVPVFGTGALPVRLTLRFRNLMNSSRYSCRTCFLFMPQAGVEPAPRPFLRRPPLPLGYCGQFIEPLGGQGAKMPCPPVNPIGQLCEAQCSEQDSNLQHRDSQSRASAGLGYQSKSRSRAPPLRRSKFDVEPWTFLSIWERRTSNVERPTNSQWTPEGFEPS